MHLNFFALKFRFSLAALMCLYGALNASEQSLELETIEIRASDMQDIKDKKVGEIKKSAKDLAKQQVSDTRDLVKYETGISVVESGRFGSSGYSIRGVDENRVAIQIDGLKQAETISSQGFKEIFEGYGNFNNTRNSIEVENIKQVNITKGADSIKAGSGALGGSVMFETKDARDYLIDKDYHYGFKVGHSSANDERMHSHTLAARFKWFDILVIKTDRDGSERKNYGYKRYDDSVRGRTREKADPYNITKEGTLVKFGFSPHEEHRFSFANDVYKSKHEGKDYSYTLYPPSSGSGFKFDEKKGEKYTNDLSERISRSFTYENFTQTPFWDSAKITFSDQKITQRARSDERCLEGDKCIDVSNPAGLITKNGNVVLQNGVEITKVEKENNENKLVLKNGQKISTFSLNTPIKDFALDCSVFDCSGKLDVYSIGGTLSKEDAKKLTIDLSKNENEFNGNNGTNGNDKVKFLVSDATYNGKKYKVIKEQEYNSYSSTWSDKTSNNKAYSIILPSSKGYLENLWKERDLNTRTRQVNFDFEKEFEIFSLENDLKYGGLYGKTEKSMINRTGYYGESAKWWANTYNPDCGDANRRGKDTGNALKCPKTDPVSSFLIPVQSKDGMVYLADKLKVNDLLEFDFGYRYDRIKYNPKYIPGVTPKIPDDMVVGVFIPVPKEKTVTMKEPKVWDYSPAGGGMPQAGSEEMKKYEADKVKYDAEVKKVKEYNANLKPQNAIDNINYLSAPKKFSSDSYAFGINLDPFEFLRIQTKYSKAFRAPTTDELYLTFRHPDMTIIPNVNLKPEIAKTKELAITFHNNSSFLVLSGFRSDYSNFIDFAFVGRERFNITGTNQNSALDFDKWQNVNRQSARVDGFEINSRLNLGDITDMLGGFYVGYKLTKQKGRILTQKDGEVPMNAIQPQTSVYSVGYATQNDKYGADMYITDVKAKKPQDTYNMFWHEEKRTQEITKEKINGRDITDYRAHWLSDKYTTIDIVAFAKPVKNLTFRLGVYNLTNKKYLTWESARSIRSFGTTNMVRKSDSLGINRFYSPGRNFKLTFEMTF
ncbi:putative hemoglobin and hemoglobin-haptoglobin-binding protein 2 [Campylobacter majalis]|uniref:Hemoglobin and hemoglobin-haptoglobin-binding protein 2 n=1 Tax=Campylobacter majalis TaxID=2790656 RepID=A0ABM8QAF5_9BACT|nr:TonB-dependent hemoglobin/transferrin/lactoferrin family receptor [Campylobacter majalis]CAD7289814.1 putative hemoglobin and hemoglobin-haptoglobin-binding protein 2 [Campylobacter majalis]